MDDREPPPPQRRHPRYEAEIRVDWSTGRMFVSDRALNISEGGLFIQSTAGLSQHSDVEMVLWLPGRPPIRAVGRVVWSHDAHALPSGIMPGGGLRFTEMPPADRAMLLEYLSEVSTGARPAKGH